MGSIPISPIDPARYYDARFVATMRGLNVATVYQSVKGLKKAPIPRVTRFNSEVKFLGQHILDFIEEHGGTGTVAQASASMDQSSKALASVPKVQAPRQAPRGRPRKAGLRGLADVGVGVEVAA